MRESLLYKLPEGGIRRAVDADLRAAGWVPAHAVRRYLDALEAHLANGLSEDTVDEVNAALDALEAHVSAPESLSDTEGRTNG